MKILCSALIVILSLPSQAQQDSSDKYKIASLIIDSLATELNFQYYHPDVPVNEALDEYLLFPDSVFTRIDPGTYEYLVKTGRVWDSILTSQFRFEQERFRLRKGNNLAVILIGSNRDISQYSDIHLYPGFNAIQQSGIEMAQLSPYNWDYHRLTTNHNFTFHNNSISNRDHYKYVIKGFVQLSNVLFNPVKDHALIQVGYQHKIESGKTGCGMFVLLAKQNGEWKIIKRMGLWEE